METLPGMELEERPAEAADPRAVALTEEQERAVSRRAEPLALSAAAGSGKTSVLVERFVRALREDALAPGKILAITFTERAAGELRARVRSRLLELGDREAARDTEAAFVGTFHGFCARLLRAHPLAAGLDPEFSIIDEGLAGRLRELAFKGALREFAAGERTAEVDLLAAYGVDRVHTMVEGAHRELRSRGQRRPRLPIPAIPEDGALERDATAACALLDELLELFGRGYEQLKVARTAVDFDDLELLARDLLVERDRVRAAWSERFELLMVDEFQDTNPRQLAILRALDRGNLFTVGDEFQSIYGFRHADVELFRTRRAELEEHGGALALTWNFRSGEQLLDVVNEVFAKRFSNYVPLVAARSQAPSRGVPAGGAAAADGASSEPAVELLLTNIRGWEDHEERSAAIAAGLPHAQTWRQAEARMLAGRISELVQSGVAQPGEIVVLLRASGDLEVFERALQLRGLRTLAAVGAFWGSQQIGDLIAYLRVLANPLDEQALYGALASPLAGCSRDGLALLARAVSEARRGAWEILLDTFAGTGEESELHAGFSPADRDALASFCARLRGERRTAPLHAISELIERAIEATGYRAHVLSLDWGERRLANVHKLLRLARRFEAREGRDLRAFLDHVEHLQEAVKVEPDAPVEGVEPDAVRLMTVHAAKGLEFPVVCLADLGRQPNTQTPDLLVDRDRVGLRLVRLDGAASSPALDYDALCQERRQREADEEDRILYVAMTRARERLLLSGSVDFERWPRARQTATPISWLVPALNPELPALLQSGEPPPQELRIAGAGTTTLLLRVSSPELAGAVDLAPAGEGPTRGEVDLAPPGEAPTATTADPAAAAPGERSSRPGEEHVERQPLPRAAAPPEWATSLSYTSLSELERCGYRYYVERVLGVGEERAPAAAGGERGLEARARGTLIHRLMESLDFASPRPPSPEDVARCARELAMRVSAAERAEIAGLIAAACAAAPAVRLAKARMVGREHPFAFSLSAHEPLVTGFIDLLAVEEEGGYVVVDYKSDRVGREVDLDDLVAREYGIQRLLYALAILRQGAPEVEIVHWFLERPEEPAGARYTAAERLELEERLAVRVARAGEDPFAVSPSPHRGLCLTCPARGGLCSWGEAETLREDPAPAMAAPP
ncbi:MAG: family ATPase [Solirubrobacterales bacterium]|nr:family ATPase [Solirubrobacterales bacterium]